MRPLVTAAAAATALGAAAAARRTGSFRPLDEPTQASRSAGNESVDADGAAERLAELVRIPTVSHRDRARVDEACFETFRDRLAELYPHTHRELEREVLDGGALLLRWHSGSDAPPLVLMAHYDVVPVDGQEWDRDPFSGAIEDGVVHGRGTIDDKGALVAVIEAVEQLVAEGFRPARDVYLSFGHDEEVAGTGARTAVETLRSRGVRPWAVVDEGGAVVSGVFPGVPGQVAVVGLAEKGVVDLEITTQDPGGHASSPGPNTAPIRLARALLRLEADPFPTRVNEVVLALIDTVGRQAPGPYRALFAHAPLLRPVLAALLSRASREANALVRTTVAITQLEGSGAPNVLATRATAVANIRVAVGETATSAVARVRRVIDDPTVTLHARRADDPSPVSRHDNDAYRTLRHAISAVYPDATVAPYVMVQASDARHFSAISDSVYRFMPFDLTREQLSSLHAANEHLTTAALARGIAVYRELLHRV